MPDCIKEFSESNSCETLSNASQFSSSTIPDKPGLKIDKTRTSFKVNNPPSKSQSFCQKDVDYLRSKKVRTCEFEVASTDYCTACTTPTWTCIGLAKGGKERVRGKEEVEDSVVVNGKRCCVVSSLTPLARKPPAAGEISVTDRGSRIDNKDICHLLSASLQSIPLKTTTNKINSDNCRSKRGTIWPCGFLLLLIQYIQCIECAINIFIFGSIFLSSNVARGTGYNSVCEHFLLILPLFGWAVSSNYLKNKFLSKKKDLQSAKKGEIKSCIRIKQPKQQFFLLLHFLLAHNKSCCYFVVRPAEDVSELEKTTKTRSLKKEDNIKTSYIFIPLISWTPVSLIPPRTLPTPVLSASSQSGLLQPITSPVVIPHALPSFPGAALSAEEIASEQPQENKEKKLQSSPSKKKKKKNSSDKEGSRNLQGGDLVQSSTSFPPSLSHNPSSTSVSLTHAESARAANKTDSRQKKLAVEKEGKKKDSSNIIKPVVAVVLGSDWLKWRFSNRTTYASKIIQNLILQASIFAVTSSANAISSSFPTPILSDHPQNQAVTYAYSTAANSTTPTSNITSNNNSIDNTLGGNNFDTFFLPNQLNSSSRKSTSDFTSQDSFPSKKFASEQNSNLFYSAQGDANEHFGVQSQSIWKRFNQFLKSEPLQVYSEQSVYIKDRSHLPNLQSPLLAYNSNLHNRQLSSITKQHRTSHSINYFPSPPQNESSFVLFSSSAAFLAGIDSSFLNNFPISDFLSQMTAVNEAENSSNDSVFAASDLLDENLSSKIQTIEQITCLILGAFGLFGAFLVIMVYNYKHKTTLSEQMITALACVDFCYNFFYMLIVTLNTHVIVEKSAFVFKVFNSANYFLFGFSVISSFLLICLITVNRFYAICRPTEYKTVFDKKKVRITLCSVFVAAFAQGSLNGAFVWLPKIVQTIIDYEFILMMDINVSGASGLMCLVYVKVLLKLAKQRRRLASHSRPDAGKSAAAQKHPKITLTERTSHKECNNEHSAMEIGESSSQHPSKTPEIHKSEIINDCNVDSVENTPKTTYLAVKKRPAGPSTLQNGVSTGLMKQQKQQLPSSSWRLARRQNNSDRVTFTLFIISVAFMFCVCPFIVDQNYVFFSEQPGNPYISLITRLIFQVNFLANPFIYFLTSRIFRGRVLELITEFFPTLASKLRQTRFYRANQDTEHTVKTTCGRSYAQPDKVSYA